MINDLNQSFKKDIWFTGGTELPFITSPKTYIMKNDGSVIKGPNLPEEVFGHCQVSHDNLVFIIGKFYFA